MRLSDPNRRGHPPTALPSAGRRAAHGQPWAGDTTLDLTTLASLDAFSARTFSLRRSRLDRLGGSLAVAGVSAPIRVDPHPAGLVSEATP